MQADRDSTYYKQKNKIKYRKINRSHASRTRTLKDALEARHGGGAKKGLAVNGEWQNRSGEDQQNCKNKKNKKTQNKQRGAIQGNPVKKKYKGKSKQKNNTKETKYMKTKEKHKTKNRTINRRRVERNLAETPLRKVVMGE